mgnify:FL=1
MVANFKWFASIHFFSPRTMHKPLICTKPFHQQVTLQVWVIVVENLKKMSLDCSSISIRLTHEQPNQNPVKRRQNDCTPAQYEEMLHVFLECCSVIN